MSPSRETFWTLPLPICLELDADQQDFIRDCIYEFEHRTKKAARAKMSLAGEAAQGISVLPRETPADGGYIKPSSASSPLAPSPRPVSIFPPGLPGTTVDKDKSSSVVDNDYMCMNGIKTKRPNDI